MNSSAFYLNIFNVTVPQMEEIIAAALSHGRDYCDLYFEFTTYNELLLRDGEVCSGGFHIDFGVGIRVLCGEKTGYAYSESTDMKDMAEAAKAASAIAYGVENCPGQIYRVHNHKNPDYQTNGRQNDTFGANFCMGILQNLYPDGKDWHNVDTAQTAKLLKQLEASVRSKESRTEKVMARMSSSQSEIMMFNSLGELTCDSRPMGSMTVSAVFSQNGRNESKSSSRSFRRGTELLSESLVEEIAAEVVSGIDSRFEASRPKGGEMPVVMGAGASGILLHEAMGHAFEADFNRKGQSVFSGRTGERICDSKINIVDDGTIPFNRGACRYDDEGVAGQKTYMVKDGILTSYLHDRISAKHFGVGPTGNGRRESFRYNPIPRMRATYMESGECTPDEIISSVKKGIYVDEFSNGQVKIGEGDFTFYVKSGFLIENGRLTSPIKDINIIGNGPRALADIIAVGNDLKIDNGTWTCGKEQSVPVSCGIPTVLVKKLIAGGD